MSWHGRNGKDLLEMVQNQGGAVLVFTVPPGMKSGEMRWADMMVLSCEGIIGKRKGVSVVVDRVVLWYLEDYLKAGHSFMYGNKNINFEKDYFEEIEILIKEFGAAIWGPGNIGFKSLIDRNNPNIRRPFYHRDNLVKPDSPKEQAWMIIRYYIAVKKFRKFLDNISMSEYAKYADYLQSSAYKKEVEKEYYNNLDSWKYSAFSYLRKNNGLLPISLSFS